LILLPIVALLVGAIIAFAINMAPVRGEAGQYLAVSCLAGLDSVCGGIRSGLEGKFRNDIFITGFISNILIAFGLAWLGDRIYLNLFLAVALVFAMRIFNNLSTIRRFGITAFVDWQAKRNAQKAAKSDNP